MKGTEGKQVRDSLRIKVSIKLIQHAAARSHINATLHPNVIRAHLVSESLVLVSSFEQLPPHRMETVETAVMTR